MWRVLCQSWVVCRFGGLLVGDGLRINWRRRGILTIDAAARFLRPPSSRTGTPSDGIHCRVNLPHTFRQASIRGVGFVLSAPEALKMLPVSMLVRCYRVARDGAIGNVRENRESRAWQRRKKRNDAVRPPCCHDVPHGRPPGSNDFGADRGS